MYSVYIFLLLKQNNVEIHKACDTLLSQNSDRSPSAIFLNFLLIS